MLLGIFRISCVIALGDFPLLLIYSPPPQINWYLLKWAFWTVSDLKLLLGAG